MQVINGHAGIIAVTSGGRFSQDIASEVAVIFGIGETFASIGAAAIDATRDIPGEVDSFVLGDIVSVPEHGNDLCDFAKVFATLGIMNGDSIEGVWQGMVAIGSDIGQFGDAFVEALIVGFSQQWHKRHEWHERSATEQFAEERASVLGTANVAFDFMTNQTSECTTIDSFARRNNELRLAVGGLIASVDCVRDALVDNAFPGFMKAVITEGDLEFATNIFGVKTERFEL